MTTVKINVQADIESALQDAIESVGLTGMGADGTSEYEINDVSIMDDGSGGWDVVVECDRVEGKFVSKDEIGELIAGEIDQLDVTCEVSPG